MQDIEGRQEGRSDYVSIDVFVLAYCFCVNGVIAPFVFRRPLFPNKHTYIYMYKYAFLSSNFEVLQDECANGKSIMKPSKMIPKPMQNLCSKK